MKIRIEVQHCESEIIDWSCEDCNQHFSEDNDGKCPHCESEDLIPEWNWEGLPCGMGCGETGQPDENHGVLYFIDDESQKRVESKLKKSQINTLKEYGEMICIKCADSLSDHIDHNNEIELEDLLEFFHE